MNPRSSEPRRIVVTGIGLITPIGNDKAAVDQSLRTGAHGLERVTFYDNPRLLPKVAGTVKDFSVDSANWREWRWPDRYKIPRETVRGLPPHGVYAMCAVSQCLEDAILPATAIAHDDSTGMYCASAGSPLLAYQNLAHIRAVRGERGNPLGVINSISGTLNFNLAAHYHITGSVCGFVSACASASHALGYASDDIRLGRIDRAIVVGAEEINADTLLPFAFMRALTPSDDPATASRPFDVARDGFVGAGGAVAMILEEADMARARGAPIYAEFAGWGQAADGYSIAISHPEGAGLQRAIARALDEAGVAPGHIDAVSTHATSTLVGDRAEALALHAIFGKADAKPVVTSTKSLTGHPLSMSGIMEAAFCLLQMSGGYLTGNPNLQTADEACAGLDLPRGAMEKPVHTFLNNSSGFGGSNVCHVFRKFES